MSIRCMLCGKNFISISYNHLRYKHDGMTISEYKEMFPDAPTVSKEYGQHLKNSHPITYTIVCPNCGKEQTFTKPRPSSHERKFCNRSCASSYLNRQTWADPEVREKRIKGITEQHQTEEYKQNVQASWTEERRAEAAQRAKDTYFEKVGRPGASDKMRKTKQDEEHRELARQQAFKRWNDPEFKERRIEEIRELAQTPEYRAMLSKRAQERWDDPIRGLEWALSMQRKPTKPELTLLDFLNNNGYENYEYTGDGSFLIGRKNPDFIYLDEGKIIELFGIYWHEENEVESRTEYFAEHGFDTLIIWDYELEDTDQLLTKLKKFHQPTN